MNIKNRNVQSIFLTVTVTFLTVWGQNCVTENERIDCYPFGGVTEASCLAKGCIYCAASSAKGTPPSCHLPPTYGYINEGSVIPIPEGYRVNLKRATNISYVGGDAEEISIFFYTEYNERIRIKVNDREFCLDESSEEKQKIFFFIRLQTTPIALKCP